MEEVQALTEQHTSLKSNRALGGIYYPIEGELHDLHGRVWSLYSATNALYPGIFPSVRKFEAEVVSMTVRLLGGDANVCGLLTSGGTESVLLAIKTLRDYAEHHKGIPFGEGEVIAAESAHGCMDKACHYFGLKLIKVPVRSSDRRLDPEEVRRHLSSNTVLVYASAPTFPHGVIDPIEEIAAVTREAGVPLHVDNCLGAIMCSMLKRAGIPIRPFDFDVDGVTTMSVDLHKFGQCAKGASVVAFSNPEIRRFAFHTVADWSGGLYVTHTMQGSRSGANIATAWATLMYKGLDGYQEEALLIHRLARRLVEEIPRIRGLKLLTDPDICMVPFTSDEFDIYAFSTELKRQRGWEIPTLQNPPCVNFCVTERFEPDIDTFLQDLADIADYMRAHPEAKASGQAGAYSSAANLPEEAVDGTLRKYTEIILTVLPKQLGGQ